MKKNVQKCEWNDIIVELEVIEFVESVTDGDFPGGPAPPGGEPDWLKHSKLSLCA